MDIKPQTARAEAEWSSSRFPHYGSSRNRCGKRSGSASPFRFEARCVLRGSPE